MREGLRTGSASPECGGGGRGGANRLVWAGRGPTRPDVATLRVDSPSRRVRVFSESALFGFTLLRVTLSRPPTSLQALAGSRPPPRRAGAPGPARPEEPANRHVATPGARGRAARAPLLVEARACLRRHTGTTPPHPNPPPQPLGDGVGVGPPQKRRSPGL